MEGDMDARIIRAVSSVTRGTGDDQWMAMRGTRDGSLFVADWLAALCMEGRGFVANAGRLTTPITGTAGAPDNLQPDVAVRVPSGTTMIPVHIKLVLEAAAGTVDEIIFGVGDTDLGNGTSNAATGGPIAIRTDAPIVSACVPRMEYTVNGSAFTDFYELAHSGDVSEPLLGLEWQPSGWVPVLVGPATLYIHAAATTTAPTFFSTIAWVEVPSTSIV